MNETEVRKQNDKKHIQSAFASLSSAVGSCGYTDALGALLSHMKISEPETLDRTSPLAALRSLGVMHRGVSLEDGWYRNAAAPMLAEFVSGGFAALLPDGFGRYAYFDFETGRTVKITRRNADAFKEQSWQLYRSFPEGAVTSKGLFAFMLGGISMKAVFPLLALGLLIGLLGLVTPAVTRMIFNEIIPAGTREDIPAVAALLTGVVISGACLGLLRSALMHNILIGAGIHLESAVLARLLSAKPEFLREHQTGDLTTRVTDFADLTGIVPAECITALTGFIFSLLYLAQIYIYAPALFNLAVLILLLVTAFMFVEIRLKTVRARGYSQKTSRLRGFVFEAFSGIIRVKLSAAESRVFSRWSRRYADMSKAVYNPSPAVKYAAAVYKFILLSGTALIFWRASAAGIAPASYIAFSAAFGALTGALLKMGGLAESVSNMRTAARMLIPLLNSQAETGGKVPSDIEGNIEISNLKFSYGKDMPPVLDGLSLYVRKGECIGIAGESGCGKSTLLRLLLGFEKPDSGAVYYDRHDLSECDVRAIRRRIGAVTQNGKLMSGDIYSNIVISDPSLTLEDAWRAAETAGIKTDIEDMPMGMFTIVSENGGGLSGGQKQRIMIARAVAHNPKILILDEATSALDNITQENVTELINGMNITRIIVAQRLSTLRQCDRILVLDKGVVSEEGSYETLMAKEGLFYKYAVRQII